MHRWLLTGLLLAGSVPGASGQGISARNRAETLAGINGVHVIVEDLPPVAEEAGLSAASIKSAVEANLRSKGIPVIGLGALTMDPRGPSLLIRVDMDFSDPVYFYYAQVQFFQNVNLWTGQDVLTSSASASTWQKGRFARIGKFRVNGLSQEINKLVDAFAVDYLKENPAALPEEGESSDSLDESEMSADSLMGEAQE